MMSVVKYVTHQSHWHYVVQIWVGGAWCVSCADLCCPRSFTGPARVTADFVFLLLLVMTWSMTDILLVYSVVTTSPSCLAAVL